MIKTSVNISSLINVAGKTKSILPDGSKYDGLARAVASTLLGAMTVRIHEKGLATDGTKIGEYNKTKPIYVNPDNYSGLSFTPQGKNQKRPTTVSTFNIFTKKEKRVAIKANNRQRMTKYFKSYYHFKTEVGRNVLGTVNLSLTRTMQLQFGIIATQTGYGLGWGAGNYAERAKGFEKKYKKKIWGLTEAERELCEETAKTYIGNAFS